MKFLDRHLCFWGQKSGCAVGVFKLGGPNQGLRSLALEAIGAAECVAWPAPGRWDKKGKAGSKRKIEKVNGEQGPWTTSIQVLSEEAQSRARPR